MRKHLMGFGMALTVVFANPASVPKDITPEPPLLQMLRYVPERTQNQTLSPLIVYGDVAAWRLSWNIPEVSDFAGLANLDVYQRNYVLDILPKQTFPSGDIGMSAYQQEQFGYSTLNVDRYIYTSGYDPDALTIEYSFDPSIIRDALINTGFNPQIVDDDLTAFGGSFGAIPYLFGMIKNGPLIFSQSMNGLIDTLRASRGIEKSLADNVVYRSAVEALYSSDLVDTGDLTGVIFLDGNTISNIGPRLAVSPRTLPSRLNQEIKRVVSELPPLKRFDLAVLATRHIQGLTYQILEVVFPQGTDTAVMASSLTERLQSYTSFSLRKNYLEANNLTVDRTLNLDERGLPIVIIVLRTPDPPLEFPAGSLTLPDSVPTNVPDWHDLAIKLDYGFLAVTVDCDQGCL